MSGEIPGFTLSVEAGGKDLSGSWYKFVKMDGATLAAVASATDAAIGVLQNKPNEPGTGVFTADGPDVGAVMVSGVSLVKVGATAVNAGDTVALDGTGAVVPSGTGTDVGVAMNAGEANGTCHVLLSPLAAVA